jgi:hypothetical protein
MSTLFNGRIRMLVSAAVVASTVCFGLLTSFGAETASAATANWGLRGGAFCPSVTLGYTSLGLPMDCFFADIDVYGSGSQTAYVYMDTTEFKWTSSTGYTTLYTDRWYASCLPTSQLGNPFCGGYTVWRNLKTGASARQDTNSIPAPSWTPQAGVYHVLQNKIWFLQNGAWTVGGIVNYSIDPNGRITRM